MLFFNFINKLIGKNRRSNDSDKKGYKDSKENSTSEVGSGLDESSNKVMPSKFTDNLQKNAAILKQVFNKCIDFLVRDINIANNLAYKAKVMYLDNMIPQDVLEDNVINILTASPAEHSPDPSNIEYTMSLLGIGYENTFEEVEKVCEAITEGKVIVLINGINKALVASLADPPSRTIAEPEVEKAGRGPRESFIENLPVNIALVRKKIKSIYLKTEMFKLGQETKTPVVISYMDNLVDKEILEELKRRLGEIKIDSVLDSNYVLEYIQDQPVSLLPTIFRTEKPDVVAAKILEGKIAVMVDGSPIVLTLPTVFSELFISSDDYYQGAVIVSIIRWARYLSFLVSLTLPAIYVSLITYHSELLPARLVNTVVRSRATVPFNAVIEAIIMMVTFNILQEADIRIPKSMGQAVSVVGALVLGEAAVSAGIVSSPMVIVAAFAGISGLAIPELEVQRSLIYMRIIVLIASGLLGLVGTTCSVLMIFIYLVSQRSFGVPFMAPFCPVDFKAMKDAIVRAPIWMINHGPYIKKWKEKVSREERKNTNRS